MVPLIQDQELRDMFRAECAEHSQKIEAGLLELERAPDAPTVPALLEEVFREAHSLKGAARMLGLRAIQDRAHEIEDLLGAARQGRLSISAAHVVPALAQLDVIRALVAEAVGDAEPGSATRLLSPASTSASTLASTSASTFESTSESASESASAPETSTANPPPAAATDALAATAGRAMPLPAPPLVPAHGPVPTPVAAPVRGRPATAEPPHPAAAPLADFRVDTLRVEANRLDALLQLGGELIVAKGRIARWQTEVDTLVARCEAAVRGTAADLPVLASLAGDLTRLQAQMAVDSARLEAVAGDLEGGILKLRLVPMATLLELFPRMVHDLAAELGKPVIYRTVGAATVADKRIVEELKAPLTHLLRNAIDHGIEDPASRQYAGKPAAGQITIVVTQVNDAIEVAVQDDGRGLDHAALRQRAVQQRLHTEDELAQMTPAQIENLIFLPGFTTARLITDVSGRGVGLDVVRATAERLRGAVRVATVPGQGTTITLRLPVSLTATRVLLLREWGQVYAVPFDDIAFLQRVPAADLYRLQERHCFDHDGQPIALERLGLLLERPAPSLLPDAVLQCVVLRAGSETFALAVDAVLDIEDIVVKHHVAPLKRVRMLAGLAVLTSGEVCPVLNLYDLLRAMQRTRAALPAAASEGAAERPRRILLAEDSITTRMQERRILEAAGYVVETAVDGMDAWDKLALHDFDAVVSDVQMPRLSGLELTERIRANPRFAELPLILVTSLASEADRRRGLEAGADAYLTKGDFDQSALLDCLARLA